MNNTLMTPDTAPRDAAALANQGPFIHRRLGEQLEQLGFKCWNNEREKTAFVTSSPQDRAQALLMQLQSYDAARGGAPAPQAAPPAMQQVVAPPPQQPAAAAPPARAPRTAPAAPQANGALQGVGMAAQAAPLGNLGPVVDLLNAIKAVGEQLSTIQAGVSGVTNAAGNQQAQINALSNEVQGLKAMLAASIRIQNVQLGLLYLFGQQVLQAPGEDILQAAVGDASTAIGIIEQLSGKG